MANLATFYASEDLDSEELNTLPIEKLITHVGFYRAFPLQSLLASATYDDKGTVVKELPGLIKTEEIDDTKFRQYEREQSTYAFTTVAAGTMFSFCAVNATLITLYDTDGLRVQDIIAVAASFANVASRYAVHLCVTGIDTSTSIVYVKWADTEYTSTYSLLAAANVTLVTNAFAPGTEMRGYSAPEAYSVQQNLQQYKEEVAMDFTALAQGSKLGENRWPEEMEYAMVRFKQEREQSMWFSKLGTFTHASQTKIARLTAGIVPYIAGDTDRVVGWDAAFGTWCKADFINTMLPKIFSDGSSEKYLFCNDKMMAGIVEDFKDTLLMMSPSDMEYNIVIRNIVTAWGTLKLAMNPMFARIYGQGSYAFGVSLQIELLKLKALKTRNVHLAEIPRSGTQLKQLEICAETGLRIGHRNAHCILGNNYVT